MTDSGREELPAGIVRLMSERGIATTLFRILDEVATRTPDLLRGEIKDLVAGDVSDPVAISRKALLLELAVLEQVTPKVLSAMRQHLSQGFHVITRRLSMVSSVCGTDYAARAHSN